MTRNDIKRQIMIEWEKKSVISSTKYLQDSRIYQR